MPLSQVLHRDIIGAANIHRCYFYMMHYGRRPAIMTRGNQADPQVADEDEHDDRGSEFDEDPIQVPDGLEAGQPNLQ
jgi:hypothetical protein